MSWLYFMLSYFMKFLASLFLVIKLSVVSSSMSHVSVISFWNLCVYETVVWCWRLYDDLILVAICFDSLHCCVPINTGAVLRVYLLYLYLVHFLLSNLTVNWNIVQRAVSWSRFSQVQSASIDIESHWGRAGGHYKGVWHCPRA